MTDELGARLATVLPETLSDLKHLVAIPSISSQPEHAVDVQRSVAAIADWVRDLGCRDLQIVSEGGAPALIAHFPAPAGQPTVCLYSHHDVQPLGERSAWTSDPLDATERDGRLYGRGTADDKGGVLAHLAALRAFDGKPPVGVTLFFEGEEEMGSPTLHEIMAKHRAALDADVFVILDSGNWSADTAAFTTTLRGVADCVVEVSTLRTGVHSGEFGGVVPDALSALCKLLATLTDANGDVAIEGLVAGKAADLDYSEERLRADAGLLEGVELVGSGSIPDRLWTRPSVSVLAIDAPSVAVASNTLIASARAKVSLRVAPGDDAKSARDKLVRHLETHAPWGSHVQVTPGEAGQPGIIPFEGPVCDHALEAMREAWGTEPVFIGQGGSIPMVADFQQLFPDATVLVTAVMDPESRAHGIDESLNLQVWHNAALAEAKLLAKLAK